MTDPQRDQIEAEIAETRAALGETMDELSAKLDVSGRAKDKVADTTQAVKQTGQRVVTTALETVQQRPAEVYGAVGALVAVAVGLIWWSRRS